MSQSFGKLVQILTEAKAVSPFRLELPRFDLVVTGEERPDGVLVVVVRSPSGEPLSISATVWVCSKGWASRPFRSSKASRMDPTPRMHRWPMGFGPR